MLSSTSINQHFPRSPKCKPLEVCDVNPNNTENNKTDINYISNPILSISDDAKENENKRIDRMDGIEEYQAYAELIKDNLDFDVMVERYPYQEKELQNIYDMPQFAGRI